VRCWCRSVGVGAVACYGDVVNSSAQRIAESLRQPHELDTSEENLQFQRGSPPRLPARTMHRHLRLAIAVTLAGCPFQPASAERLGRADIGLRGRIMTRELLSSDTMEGSDNVTMPTPVGFEEGSDNMTTPSPVDLPTPVPVPVPIPMPMGTCTDTSEGSFWGAILEQTSVADAVPGFNVSAEVCLQGEAAFPEEEFAALTASCCLICTETEGCGFYNLNLCTFECFLMRPLAEASNGVFLPTPNFVTASIGELMNIHARAVLPGPIQGVDGLVCVHRERS